MTTTTGINQAEVDKLTRQLIDQGKVIEAGWIGLKLSAVPPEAPEIQVREMRHAFFAGAQHLFASIMAGLDPGAEPTEADMQRMTQIAGELDAFIQDFELRQVKTEGSG